MEDYRLYANPRRTRALVHKATEGNTDPELYQQLTGLTAEQVYQTGTSEQFQ